MTRKEAAKLYRSREWKRIRVQVLQRDDYRCRDCGRAGRLEVHHLVAVRRGGAKLDPGNLLTLCFRCHRDRHARADPWRYRLSKM